MKKILLSGVALAALLVPATDASAQNRAERVSIREQPTDFDTLLGTTQTRGLSVYDRQRPDFTPVSIRAGSFVFVPTVSFNGEYNDNIFFTDDGVAGNSKEEDLILSVTPGLRINSDWNRHAVSLFAEGTSYAYMDNDSQNHNDYNVGTAGRYDLGAGFNAKASATYQQLHEDRFAPNNTAGNSQAPTRYHVTATGVELEKSDSILGFMARGDYREFDYSDNSDRNNQEYLGTLEASYEIKRGYRAFVRGKFGEREYDGSLGGFKRDSEYYEAVGGARFDVATKLVGDIYGGYAERDYNDNSLEDLDAVLYGASLLWDINQISTLQGDVFRSLEDSIVGGFSGYLATVYRLRYEHELKRNLLVGLTAQYSQNDFEGTSSREDDEYLGEVGVRYLISRNVSAGVKYAYFERDSDALGQDFDQNTVYAGLNFQF